MRNMSSGWRAVLRNSAAACLALGGLVAVAGCGSGSQPATNPSADIAGGLQAKYTRIVDTVSPQVVEIRTAQALGSGIVYDTRGGMS
jgi:putative serine protease PepD